MPQRPSPSSLAGVDDVQWRSLTLADVSGCAELMAAAEHADDTGEHFSVADVQAGFEDPALDLARDTLGAFDGARMVAFGRIVGTTEVWDSHLVGCPGTVHPDYRGRGLGARLVRSQLDRAAALHAERHPHVPGQASVGVATHLEDAKALMGDLGLQPRRQFFDMERLLSASLPPPTSPGDPLRIVAFDWARDDEVRRAHNEAFRGHYGSTQRDPASWKQWFTGNRNFRPELSLLVLAGPEPDAELAGYLLGYFYQADQAATGLRDAWVGQLGTRLAYRRRGVGTALLSHALTAHRDQGYDQTSLDVDSENGTGALALYERVGFAVTKSWTSWEVDLPSAG